MLGALTVAVNHEISRPVLRFLLIKNRKRILTQTINRMLNATKKLLPTTF